MHTRSGSQHEDQRQARCGPISSGCSGPYARQAHQCCPTVLPDNAARQCCPAMLFGTTRSDDPTTTSNLIRPAPALGGPASGPAGAPMVSPPTAVPSNPPQLANQPASQPANQPTSQRSRWRLAPPTLTANSSAAWARCSARLRRWKVVAGDRRSGTTPCLVSPSATQTTGGKAVRVPLSPVVPGWGTPATNRSPAGRLRPGGSVKASVVDADPQALLGAEAVQECRHLSTIDIIERPVGVVDGDLLCLQPTRRHLCHLTDGRIVGVTA